MVTEGTVIHGTGRLEDLIPAFIAEIDAIKESLSLDGGITPEDFGRLDDRLGEIERRAEVEGYYETDEAYWDLETLFDILSELAPEGMYFGAHEGDGSDYGFWTVDND